jgi:hypothetical protein
MEWVANATTHPFYPRERDPVPIGKGAGWAQGPVWTGEENLSHHWDSIPQTVQPVASTIPIELPDSSMCRWEGYNKLIVRKQTRLIYFN